MPITEQTYRVLFENLDPAVAVKTLLSREIRPELDRPE
jgi:glycerol-3-phosphate dehydrogenase (NAD(P)+)